MSHMKLLNRNRCTSSLLSISMVLFRLYPIQVIQFLHKATIHKPNTTQFKFSGIHIRIRELELKKLIKLNGILYHNGVSFFQKSGKQRDESLNVFEEALVVMVVLHYYVPEGCCIWYQFQSYLHHAWTNFSS